MSKKNILSRFNEYQKERFPFAVLIFTTLSVVLSSFIVIMGENKNIFDYSFQIIISFLVCLLFTFHIRVLDEYKDFSHDNKFHKKRPIQRGLISLKELKYLNIIGIFIQILLISSYSLISLVYWSVAFCYSILGKYDFFIKNLKKNFVIYNFMNLILLLFLQIFLYSMISHPLQWNEPILYIHFVYFLLNVLILEFGRKIKVTREETQGNDTYSVRFGLKKSCIIYSLIIILAFLFLLWILFLLNVGYLFYIISFTFFIVCLISLIMIYFLKNKISSIYFQINAILFYVGSDIILILVNIFK